jgi:hypothetical protein
MRALPVLLTLLLACGWFGGKKITDETVANYIKAYVRLKQAGPELAERMRNAQGKEIEIDQGMAGYNEIEKIIKESGFESYQEFVEVNAKIGLAFSQIEGRQFMNEMDQMHSIGFEEIDKQLADPQVPEEAKAELRRARKEGRREYGKEQTLGGGSDERRGNDRGQRKPWRWVRRHAKEIRDAYTGGDCAAPRGNSSGGICSSGAPPAPACLRSGFSVPTPAPAAGPRCSGPDLASLCSASLLRTRIAVRSELVRSFKARLSITLVSLLLHSGNTATAQE